jgi:hypothetical protein
LHEIAAAFTFGREDLIPDMFRSIVSDLDKNFPGKLDTFRYYLDRHIELDEEVHTPLALQMIEELCGEDEQKWLEAKQVARECLKARIKLWDGIEHSIKERKIEEAIL